MRLGESSIVVAGGHESMSHAPHCLHLRNGVKMGDAQLIDTMIKDGLWDIFNGYHMGMTARPAPPLKELVAAGYLGRNLAGAFSATTRD